MEPETKGLTGMGEIMSQAMDQSRVAMENYLNTFKSISTLPWAGLNWKANAALSEKVNAYIGQNITSAFEHAQKLGSAKDLHEVLKIQMEFIQTQIKSFNEQARDIGEIATRLASGAVEPPTKFSS